MNPDRDNDWTFRFFDNDAAGRHDDGRIAGIGQSIAIGSNAVDPDDKGQVLNGPGLEQALPVQSPGRRPVGDENSHIVTV
ncbi:hypothetical protein D3OALGA1CA_2485 [Olavius algarvensis associated proteobacterium Delta 3]|nr:hypothetical protein D3OALGA1CA_2485 [Olavius algarvensis associated proteobacterium Delta 3]CAB5154674.1 hypothetical protein D3OALGB2SA_5024 [Olavius algarvensis associated proteobacterium Delta 3]